MLTWGQAEDLIRAFERLADAADRSARALERFAETQDQGEE